MYMDVCKRQSDGDQDQAHGGGEKASTERVSAMDRVPRHETAKDCTSDRSSIKLRHRRRGRCREPWPPRIASAGAQSAASRPSPGLQGPTHQA
jgi:hypothetical protein